MKTIHLIRHAKSSWKDASLADRDRPLNARGIKACKLMASHIVSAGCDFEHVFCSTAKRAQLTIAGLSGQLSDRRLQWQIDEDLYTFDSGDLHQWFGKLDESLSEVVIVGHNPALTDLCNELSNAGIENIPTCGYVKLTAERTSQWRDVSATPFSVAAFLQPKALIP